MIQELIDKIEELENYPDGPDQAEFYNEELQQKALQMEAAMIHFVRRCELGQIRSTFTYNQFKDILGE